MAKQTRLTHSQTVSQTVLRTISSLRLADHMTTTSWLMLGHLCNSFTCLLPHCRFNLGCLQGPPTLFVDTRVPILCSLPQYYFPELWCISAFQRRWRVFLHVCFCVWAGFVPPSRCQGSCASTLHLPCMLLNGSQSSCLQCHLHSLIWVCRFFGTSPKVYVFCPVSWYRLVIPYTSEDCEAEWCSRFGT